MDTSELRRVREYVAWLFLVAAIVLVVVGALDLLGLAGWSVGPGPIAPPTVGPVSVYVVGVSTFAQRGQAAVSSLAAIDMTLLFVAAVLLAAIGRPVRFARPLVMAAVITQGVALALALIGWGAAITQVGGWFPLAAAAELVVAVAALILTTAVLRSPALRRPAERAQPAQPADSATDPAG